MTEPDKNINIPEFAREFYDNQDGFTALGKGKPGGKAEGLAFLSKVVSENLKDHGFSSLDIYIPRFTVIMTGVFDKFMERNDLYDIAFSDENDIVKALAFIEAELPVEIVGDLRSLIEKITTPLAIRSSCLLEDNINEPFAGIYATKMVPNNQASIDQRFSKLVNAIKFVYASTYFKQAVDYIKSTPHSQEDEKMAVIIQDVVGVERNKRFYPQISGVARSYNYYPAAKSKPEDGIVSLALGLGKQIVDGGSCWSYSPAYPRVSPPYNSINDLMKNTQTTFWAVNMDELQNYDPAKETEYLLKLDLKDAELDGMIKLSASTYNRSSDKVTMGIGTDGPRVLNFAQLLQLNEFKFNNVIRKVIQTTEDMLGKAVELEFAITFDRKYSSARLGLLQARPMFVSSEKIELDDKELTADDVLVSSNKVLGNGITENIRDVVYVKPGEYDKKNNKKIALEIEKLNNILLDEGRPYLLIGFGRWGSSDPWLGIPVNWGQISGAKSIVEATQEGINTEMSQGSHFFHNLISFRVSYFSVSHEDKYKIDFDWLEKQKTGEELNFVKHITTASAVKICIDGRTGRGVIKK